MICSGVRPVGFDDRQWLATGCGGTLWRTRMM
jgi:hypothetical protein